MIRAILSDYDGVICDTEQVHYNAFAQVLAKQNISLTELDYYEKYCHGDDRNILTAILKDHEQFDTDLLKQLCDEKAVIGMELLQGELISNPGTVDFLKRCHAAGMYIAVVSMALRAEILIGLKATGLDAIVRCIVSAEDVNRIKPDPEPYLKALDTAKAEGFPDLSASECLVLEDTPGGAKSGAAAGMTVWGVGNTRPAEDLIQAGATQYFHTLSNVDLPN